MYFAFPNPVARTFPAQVSPGCGIGDQHRALCWEQAEPQSPGHWAHPLCPCSPASVTPSYPGTNKSINGFLLQEPKARDCWSPGQSGTSQNSPVQLFPEHPLGVNTQHRALAESSPCCFNTEYIFIFPLPKKSSEILLFLSFLFFTFFFPFSFPPPPFFLSLGARAGNFLVEQLWERIHNSHHGFQIFTDSWRIKFRYFLSSARGLWGKQEAEFPCSCAPTLCWKNLHNQKFQMQGKSCLAPGLAQTHCE